MLASIIITDADEVSARAYNWEAPFIALDIRCSTGAARTASLCISPGVARQLRDAINGVLADLEVAQRAEQRAEVSGGREAV